MNTKEIYKRAKKVGMSQSCKENMRSDMSVENLCKMFFNEDNWALENDFPSLDILQEFKGQSEEYGIYTDLSVRNTNEQNSAYFGSSNVLIGYNKYSVGKVILRHETKAKIIAKDHAIVIVNILDESELEIECYDKASVIVFCYGNHNVKSIGNVKVQTSTFKK